MFTLNLVTPEKKLVTDLEVDEVIVPAFRGQLDILPGHAPLMTTLEVGLLMYKAKGASTHETVVVAWGYAQINKDGVIILAETAESVEEINKERAAAALKKAQAELLAPILEPDQIHELQSKVAKAQARLQAVGVHNDTTH
jgi:F-type H+-transporting ATPase subunit epsilon